jgi:hypothetical protein
MADIYFESNDYHNVHSCIKQFCIQNHKETRIQNGTYIIAVFFPDMAMQIMNHYVEEGQLCVVPKEIFQYINPENRAHAQKIWNNGYVPIEIMKNGGGIFFGINKAKIEARHYDYMELEEMEDI